MIMFTPWLMPNHAENDGGEVCSFGYEALTPTELEPEKARSYIDALNFAYEQRDIRNIAVTGPYGAGKSSVIKTWCKAKDGALRVLTVSLADFDMQNYADDANTSSAEGSKEEEKKTISSVEKSIEYSILQQILYKNKKHELPYSRIDRISCVTVEQIAQSATLLTGIMLLTGIALFFLAPHYVTAKLSLPEVFSRYLLERPFAARLAGVVVSLAGSLGLLLSQLHRIGIFDRKVSLDKVDLLKGAVTTRPSSPSLLNIYIDEIVYFFDSTRYDVVIFEDLDRFNSGRIFIKLREINQIINNCLSDRKPVKFIYAVRDGVFNSVESRTKFFDFVMPVIPVMDNQNASDHFSKKFKKEELKEQGLSECIARIATFIPNMRVMHNITNEFRLYQNIVNNRENLTKLLAMIAYKNLCAEDYHSIDSKKGILYNFIKEYIDRDIQNDILASTDNDIEESRKLLEKIEKEKNEGRKALRKELLEPYINENHKHLLIFQTDRRITLEEAIEEEEVFFNILNEREINTVLINQNQYFFKTSGNETKRLRSEYNERCPIVDAKNNDDLKKIKSKLSSLDSLKEKIYFETVSEISIRLTNARFIEWIKIQSEAGVILDHGDNEQHGFIFFLLSNGYLSTDYMFYRSIFMAGGLSENDNAFLKAVMAGSEPEKTFHFHLDNTYNVIDRLRKLGVLQRYNAQHPAVITWLLDNDALTLRQNLMLLLGLDEGGKSLFLLEMTLKDWSIEQRLRYLNFFVSHEDILMKLVTLLCEHIHLSIVHEITACLFCVQNSGRQLIRVSNIHYIKRLINTQVNILNSLPDGYSNFFIENIRQMNIKLPHIPLADNEEQKECLHNIVSLGLFSFSDVNIENICRSLTRDTNISQGEFLRRPLMLIESLHIPHLETVIYENINAFISSIFIKSKETNRVHELLGLKNISLDTTELLINEMEFQVDALKTITNRTDNQNIDNQIKKRNIYSMLINKDRVLPSISNLVQLLHDDEIDHRSEVVQWANDNDTNLKPSEMIFSSSHGINNFLVKFICSPHLHEKTLLLLIPCFKICFIDVPKTISLRTAEVLYSENKLAPILDVFTGLYTALCGDKQNTMKMNTLLSNLIADWPPLLSSDPDEIFYIENDFDVELARMIFDHHRINDNSKVRALRWLKDKDPALLGQSRIMSLHTLAKFNRWTLEDALRLPLLRACLTSGDADKNMVTVVLNSFANVNYHGLLPQERFRKIPHSPELWELAELLSEAGFIHPPKLGSGRDAQKIVITPPRHYSDGESEE
ncbi:hypothetical protein [Citrobacter sp. BDA59-3]|uniref:YobI family P-loop NTPase n=1 Tax=Citrobacter sp. BDA59-3 TaxID=2781952 RepID=UPI0018829C24|nr:hypothetical protein [Citrobacter sp. BDA59-3]QOV70877.1 hypothetical protein IP582_11080 [Citrobacter sp. BDA59-3]